MIKRERTNSSIHIFLERVAIQIVNWGGNHDEKPDQEIELAWLYADGIVNCRPVMGILMAIVVPGLGLVCETPTRLRS